MSAQPPVRPQSPVKTTDNRVTDPRVSQNGGMYQQHTDQQRQKAADALSRKPYFSTRPPDPSTQSQIAKESDR